MLNKLGINRDRLGKVTATLNLRMFFARHVPSRVLDYIPESDGAVSRESETRNVDWASTDAIASGQGPVYLNIDQRSDRYDQIRERIRTGLLEVTAPDGSAVADAVHFGEDQYDGPFISEAPDLVIEQAQGVHIAGKVGRGEVFSDTMTVRWRAENKRHGLFTGVGPSFRTGEIDGLSILDLAPTILHLHDEPIPASMDGEVSEEVFDPDAEVASRPIAKSGRDETEAEIERVRRAARALEGF
jgi:predicted AlkP superfamily phosphohydrolase/phosphomutase